MLPLERLEDTRITNCVGGSRGLLIARGCSLQRFIGMGQLQLELIDDGAVLPLDLYIPEDSQSQAAKEHDEKRAAV